MRLGKIRRYWRLFKPRPSDATVRLVVFASLVNIAVAVGSTLPSGLEPSSHQQIQDAGNESPKKSGQQDSFWRWFFTHPADASAVFGTVFNGLLVYVTYRLVISTNRLWEAGERQIELTRRTADAAIKSAEAALASNRAWLKLDIGDDVRTSIIDDTLVASFKLVITNTGGCPASRIFIGIYPFFDSFSNSDFNNWAAKKGEEIRKYNIIQGPMLFPGETDPPRNVQSSRGLNGKMIDVRASEIFASRFGGVQGFVFRALICVSYLSLPDTKVHLTRKLVSMNGREGGIINVQDIDASPFGLVLRATNAFGPGDYAD